MEPHITTLTLFDDQVTDDRPERDEPTAAPLLLTITQTARLLGLGRTTVYGLIGDGHIEMVHIGRSARVPAAAVETFVDDLRSKNGRRP